MVKVIANQDGNLIATSPNNPAWGWYKLEEERQTITPEGIVKVEKLTAIVQGWVRDIKTLNWKINDTVPGRIIIRESLTPFNKKNPEKDLKMAGDSGIVCSVGGAPIYRRYFYNANSDAQDQLVAHDNNEEIKEAYLGQLQLGSVDPLADEFNL